MQFGMLSDIGKLVNFEIDRFMVDLKRNLPPISAIRFQPLTRLQRINMINDWYDKNQLRRYKSGESSTWAGDVVDMKAKTPKYWRWLARRDYLKHRPARFYYPDYLKVYGKMYERTEILTNQDTQ
jgi:hypothetical protein